MSEAPSYDERNALACAFAALADELGWAVGVREAGPEWAVISIETPEGQVGFHVPVDEVDSFGPASTPYDGHDKETAIRRLRALYSIQDEECRHEPDTDLPAPEGYAWFPIRGADARPGDLVDNVKEWVILLEESDRDLLEEVEARRLFVKNGDAYVAVAWARPPLDWGDTGTRYTDPEEDLPTTVDVTLPFDSDEVNAS